MKGRDVIALFEYGRAFNSKTKKIRRRRKEPVMDFDELPEDMLINKLENLERKADKIRTWLDKRSKLAKAEEKKEPDKKGWDSLTFIQKFTVLTMLVPLCMMAYSLLIILFVKIAAKALGL